MYVVSQPKSLSDSQNQELAKEDSAVYPPGYFRFLRRFGEGTYRGWMNVQLPDTEVLKPFAEYGLWDHDEGSGRIFHRICPLRPPIPAFFSISNWVAMYD